MTTFWPTQSAAKTSDEKSGIWDCETSESPSTTCHEGHRLDYSSKQSTISFTMLPRKNAADDSDKPFNVPRYLQRKNERHIVQKTLTGTATSKDTFMAARNGNSVRELFVSRVSKEVKLDDLKNYVESKGFTVLNVKHVSHNEAKNTFK